MCCFRFVGFVVLEFKRRELIGGDWSVWSDLVCPVRLSYLSLDFHGVVLYCQAQVTDRTAVQTQQRLVWEEEQPVCARYWEGTARIWPPLLAQAVTKGIAT